MKILTYLLISLFIVGCGDIFNYKKKITGQYYLIEIDTKENVSICYETKDGDCIGRIPATVLEYGFSDSFIAAKSKQNNIVSHYIINRKRDSDYADKKDFLIGPQSEQEFNEERKRINIELIKVDY